MKTDKITLFLIALILLAFSAGAFRVQQQAAQIQEIIDAQSPLIFSFQSTEANNQTVVTFLVTCTKADGNPFYVCATEQKGKQ